MEFNERAQGLYSSMAALDEEKKEFAAGINQQKKDAIEQYSEETGMSVLGIKEGYRDFCMRAKDEGAYCEMDADRDRIMSAISGDKAVPDPPQQQLNF